MNTAMKMSILGGALALGFGATPAWAAPVCPTNIAQLTSGSCQADVDFVLAPTDVRMRHPNARGAEPPAKPSDTESLMVLTGPNTFVEVTMVTASDVNVALHPGVAPCDAAFLAQVSGGNSQYCILQAAQTLDGVALDRETLAQDQANGYSVSGTNYTFKLVAKAANKGVVSVTKKAAPPPGPAPAAQSTPSTCSSAEVTVPSADLTNFRAECSANGELCLDPAGTLIHVPVLKEGNDVTIVLYRPEVQGTFEIDATFKRSQVLKPELRLQGPAARAWSRGPTHTIRLTSAGTLKVTTRAAIPSLGINPGTPQAGVCTLPSLEKNHSFDVTGHYHFMLGVMPTYAGLYERSFTLHQSDDGVQRVFPQDEREIDLAATLSAFPFGVSTEDPVAVGFVLGTGLRELGKRWYAGLEVASPIGFGIAGGAAFISVPELDSDFVPGQPLADTRVPTHDTIETTWFVGIDVQAELFRRAFEGLADED